MADKSLIEWLGDPFLNIAGATWNLWWGCTVVSDECFGCYIPGQPPLRQRHLVFDKHAIGGRTGIVFAERRVLFFPLRRTKPLLIFPESLGDLWHPEVPDETIAEMWAVMLLAWWHIFQTTTKRPGRQANRLNSKAFADLVAAAVEQIATETSVRSADLLRAREHLADRGPDGAMRALPNVWIGITVGSNKSARTRLPYLRRTPATVRWVSAEPIPDPNLTFDSVLDGVDYVVFGGESGPKYKVDAVDTGPGSRLRDLDLGHLARLIDQARTAGAAVFVKQLGTPWAVQTGAVHPKGGNWDEWPEHLRIRQYPRQLAERALRYMPDNVEALAALAPPLDIVRTGMTSRYVWPDSTKLLQGGRRGVVMAKDGRAYRTAFVEAFTQGTFLRGEGATITEAETAVRGRYLRITGCPTFPDHGPFDRGSYTNGSGFCVGCGTWFPRVLPEIPDDREPSLLERALTGDHDAALTIVSTVAEADSLPEGPHV
jgi:protein gp37